MKICPVCESGEQKHFGNKNNFDLIRCRNCQTLYSDSQKAEAFDYTTYYDEENLDVPDFVKFRLAEIVSEFDKFRKNNRLLDIGCGAGYLLEEAVKQKWDAYGTEVSDPAVEDLRARGLNVFQGDLSEIEIENDSFDVVTCTEVVEHIPNPVELMKAAHRFLREGGLFWGTTPNGNGVSIKMIGQEWSAVAPPEHILLFSPKSLANALKQAGFRNVKVSTHGVNPVEIYQALRGKSKKDAPDAPIETTKEELFDRVNSSYQINEALSKGVAKSLIKTPANIFLNIAGLGDSLKFWAIK